MNEKVILECNYASVFTLQERKAHGFNVAVLHCLKSWHIFCVGQNIWVCHYNANVYLWR